MHEDRKQSLSEFVSYVRTHLTGDEKGEAQIFLDRLFKAFDLKGVKEAGATLEMRLKKRDEGGTAFADLVYKPIVLIEMKKRGTDLRKHYRQAFDYWVELAPNRPKYVVLCNFDQFWVYDFDSAQYDEPLDKLPLDDLPKRWGPLAFLFRTRERPTFLNDHEDVTRKAAHQLAECFSRMRIRGVEQPLAQRFILQMLVALFAEDIELLPKYFVTHLLDECKTGADAYDLLGGLFEAMNKKSKGGRFKDVDYFNGGLFAEPARVELKDDELNQLRGAAQRNWSMVRPEIFGVLFEHSVEDQRRALGAHFTHPVDILKVVGPTIVEPWREQIIAVRTREDAVKLLERMAHYTVLDPACGSGNFLYIAYRELKRLEAQLAERLRTEFPVRGEAGTRRFGFVTARQFFGIDISPFAVELAKVTMMIARKLAIDELHITEQALPLDRLDDNFFAGDALIDERGLPRQWPKVDVIIGNPPFIGAKFLKPHHGAKYVNDVRKAYPEIPGMADYCVYWFRKAHDNLPKCMPDDPVAGRAGLVGTQNIRNNKSRVGGLDHIVQTGTIVEAVDNQPWSGEANVNVSIANWIKSQDVRLVPKKRKLWFKVGKMKTKRRKGATDKYIEREYELASRLVTSLNSALSDQVDVSAARTLSSNEGFCYTGQYPRHDGFMLGPDEATQMLVSRPANRAVLWPFVVGREMLSDGLDNRWVIDFQTRSILEAKSFAEPFAHLERRTLPYIREKAEAERKKTNKIGGQDQNWLNTWWQHFRPRPELIGKITAKERYIVCSRVTKRPIFVFLSSSIRPGDALTCFAMDDDYSFGILQSAVHWFWFVTKCSKLTERFRYTPESVFDTFPWPQSPKTKQIDAIAAAGREVRRLRRENLPKINGGLRALYRTLELPGANPLKNAHAELDTAVMAAYGFDAKKDLLAQLLELNLDVARRISAGESVVAPGIPPNYPNPKELVTDDCIKPRKMALFGET